MIFFLQHKHADFSLWKHVSKPHRADREKNMACPNVGFNQIASALKIRKTDTTVNDVCPHASARVRVGHSSSCPPRAFLHFDCACVVRTYLSRWLAPTPKITYSNGWFTLIQSLDPVALDSSAGLPLDQCKQVSFQSSVQYPALDQNRPAAYFSIQ